MSDEKKKMKYRRYGKIIYLIISAVSKTMSIKDVKHPNYCDDENYIYAVWHEKIIFPTISKNILSIEKKVSLVSPSNDGEMLEELLLKYNYEIIRGSSNSKNIASLKQMLRKLKAGYSLGFGVDGPKGPIYQIKPGILYMSQKTGVKIMPVGGAISKKKIFEKAWDKFQFPKPFSKAVCYFGEPIEIPKDKNFEDYIEIVNEKIHEANREAEKILNG